jgi:NTE family protein
MLHKRSRKVGYALGGGAARGLSHIGVLKVFEEHGVFPNIITGTSMGALIGALYAGGIKVGDIEQLAVRLGLGRLALLADMTLPFSGLIGGRRVISLLKTILGDLTFSQLKYDFACVATDINTGEQVVLREGSLVEAVRASISLPGIFTPIRVKGRYLVDGGLVNEVPVSVCREMGAGYVIGVNVIPGPSRMMHRSKKGRPVRTIKSVQLDEIQEERKLTVPSSIERLPLVSNVRSIHLISRFDDIENAVSRFLVRSRPKLHKEMLKPLEWTKKVNPKRLKPKTPSLIDVLSQTLIIAEYKVAMENLKHADLVISPEVEDIGFWQFHKAAQAIALGEEAARLAIQQNNSLISSS